MYRNTSSFLCQHLNKLTSAFRVLFSFVVVVFILFVKHFCLSVAQWENLSSNIGGNFELEKLKQAVR